MTPHTGGVPRGARGDGVSERAAVEGGVAEDTTSGPVASWMIAIVLGLALFGWLQERIPVRDELGFDGRIYGALALAPRQVFHYPPNRVQRCLPSLLVGATIRVLGLPREPRTVVRLFLLLNTALVLVGVRIWIALSRELRLGKTSAIIGFVGLFVSFSAAKMPYYYPVLTDTSAMLLGLLAAYYYFRRSFPGLMAVFVVSAAVWPSLMPFVPLLILFPRPLPAGVASAEATPTEATPTRWPLVLAAAVTIPIVALAGRTLLQPGWKWSAPLLAAAPLSLGILALYLCLGFRELLACGRGFLSRPSLLPVGIAKRFMAVVAVFAVVFVVLGLAVQEPVENGQTPRDLVRLFLESSVFLPGSFLVGHAVNFGILFIGVLVLWRETCRAATRHGLGAWLFLGAALAFSINAESRHATALWPMVVALLCSALERRRWPPSLLWSFCVLSFLNSRVWLQINADFPALYFAHFVLNTSRWWYLTNAVALATAAALLSAVAAAAQLRRARA
jgi:hypothetical protein